MSAAPLCWVDIETSGFDPTMQEVLSVACINEKGEELMLRVRPEFLESANQESLKIAGYDPELWERTAVSKSEAARQVVEFTKGLVMAGHFVSFDLGFLTVLLQGHGYKPLWQRRTLDTVPLAFALMKAGRAPASNLDAACAALGMEPRGEAHDPLDDARRARAVFDYFVELVGQKKNE